MDIHPIPLLRYTLLAVLLAPLAAAAVCGLAGAAGRNPRRFAMWFALLHLGATAILLGGACVHLTQRGDITGETVHKADAQFRPTAVPGDPARSGDPDAQTGDTEWGVLPLGAPPGYDLPPPEVQFYVGLDGLNVWLVAMTSLLTMIAVLLSLDAVTDRPGGYYGWVFVLQTGVTGAFVAFDVILFYVFFELTLIPTFFLIGSWGVGGARREAARKFFLYTLFGSLLTLTGLVGLVLTNPTPVNPITHRSSAVWPLPAPGGGRLMPAEGPITFSLPRLMENSESWALAKWFDALMSGREADALAARAEGARAAADEPAARRAEAELADARKKAADARAEWDRYKLVQGWLFVALVAGFAVKIPVIPFHTWLPAAYAEAPAPVTMLLSGLLAKLGTYGVLRLVLPLTPDAALAYGLPVFGTLGAAGVIYAALCAYAQRDVKLLTAYSSVSHLGFIVMALFAFNREGLAGATLHMVNHGLATGAMFGLLTFLVARYRTLDMNQYGGLWSRFPGYTFLVFVIALASIGLPGLNNFVGEMLMLAGLFDRAVTNEYGYWFGVAAAVGILLSAWYTLTMLRRVFFGPTREPPAAAGPAPGMTGRERFAFAVPAVLCLVLGILPQPVLETMRADVAVVTLIGDHARMRSGTYVGRPDPLPLGALIGAPALAPPEPLPPGGPPFGPPGPGGPPRPGPPPKT